MVLEALKTGKTGTSQVVSKREGERGNNKQTENHAIYTGFAPSHDPKYAISVVVDHGKSGSAAAAPIARDVMMQERK
jgi:penicillin-binding protein 2